MWKGRQMNIFQKQSGILEWFMFCICYVGHILKQVLRMDIQLNNQ